MEKKTNYVYGKEQDEFIVKTIKDDFKKRQEERKNQELTWELNINYMVGNQYACISPRGMVEPMEKSFYWESREVFNHIAPIIETRLSKLAKVRPTATVRPSGTEQSDLYCAKLSKSILNNTFNKLTLSDLIAKATAWSEITGTSFYKVSWNSEMGDTIALADGAEIKAGDVEISVCSPYEIFPDNSACAEVQDCASIIHARAYPAAYVKDVYGTEETGEDIDSLVFDEMTYRSGISGRSNVTKLTHITKHDHVLVLERYEKPSKKRPKGRLTIVAGNTLVYDDDLPYSVASENKRGYPFVRQISSSQIGSFWGTSVIERCIPVQRAYNALKNRKHEFIARLSAGVLAVEDGSVDVDNLEDEGLAPGKILVYRAGSEKPEFMDAGSVPKEIGDEEDKLLAEFNILSGVSEIMRDSTLPSAVSSGSAITLLLQQDETRMETCAEHIRGAVKEIAEMVIRLYKQFASTKRLSEIADESGAIEVYYWTGADLTNDDVVLDTTNELTESASHKKSVLMELYNAGLLADENGKVSNRTKVKILESLGFNMWENSQDISVMHSKKAIKENLNISATNLIPLEIDDHEIHIEEHTRFLISDDAEKFSAEHKQKILDHIKQHKDMLKQQGE